MSATASPDFAALLATATTEPGTINAAYSLFHAYSISNQIYALLQCHARGIAIGPIATYHRWHELGRQVRKGEKAIEMCQPVTCKRTPSATAPTSDGDGETFTRFVYRRNWFTLGQTDGEPYEQPAPPEWNKARALAALDITEAPFESLNGNTQGYAKGRTVAINPLDRQPLATLFHEIAHIILGHTEQTANKATDTPRSMREVEAEGVAMLCCAALGLPGIDESRAYIQGWYGAGREIPEDHARRIFKATDAILRAGRAAVVEVAR